jgi:hypothetical protein
MKRRALLKILFQIINYDIPSLIMFVILLVTMLRAKDAIKLFYNQIRAYLSEDNYKIFMKDFRKGLF